MTCGADRLSCGSNGQTITQLKIHTGMLYKGSDPPRRTSYNGDANGCFFAGTIKNENTNVQFKCQLNNDLKIYCFACINLRRLRFAWFLIFR